jgi:hypothetical protein
MAVVSLQGLTQYRVDSMLGRRLPTIQNIKELIYIMIIQI